MTFEELLREVKKIKCQEMRAHQENYLEVVVAKPELEAVTTVLQSYFSLPLKPAGEHPSKEANAYSEPYGGIQSNQTMYFRKNETASDLAFLWPWGSGTAITVKIIRE